MHSYLYSFWNFSFLPYYTIAFFIPPHHTSLQEYFIYQYNLSLACLLPVMV